LALSSEALISLAQATMASYATVPAADLESEATLLNKPKAKTKTSLLVGGVAAAAFVCGVLSMTALRTSPSVRSATFSAETSPNTAIESLPTDCDGGPLAVGDAVELQNINAAPALNGKTGTVTVSAQIKCRGGILTY